MRTPLISPRARILGVVLAAVCLVTMTCAFVVMVFIAAHLTGRVNTQQTALQHQQDALVAQTAQSSRNRVLNVSTWCAAINHDRNVLRAYVKAFSVHDPAIPLLVLPDLPCTQIARRTAQSTN